MTVHIEWKRRLQIIGIGVGVYIAYRFLLPAGLPFLAAWGLACWLYPPALKIEKRTRLKRGIGGAVLLTLLFAAAGILFWLCARELLSQIKTAVENIPALVKWGRLFLERCCLFLEDSIGIARGISENYILTRLDGISKQAVSAVSAGNLLKIGGCIKKVMLFGSGIVVVYISTVLILSDMENLRKKVREYSWLTGVYRAAIRLKKTTVTYLKAQAVIIGMVAAVCTVGFWMMGSQYFLILGIVLGLLDVLPLIGTGSFLYPAAVFFLLKGDPGSAFGCVALDLLTSVLREFMEPRLLGGKLGISPIAVLACVYLGVLLFGGTGVILGPLAFSTAYELGREWDVWD